MFLHLGCDVIIKKKEIVGIFTYDHKKVRAATKEFLNSRRSEKKIMEISQAEKAKSIVVTDKNLYFSPISSSTLQKRAQLPYERI